MATPIRIKRSAVAGKKPTEGQLQLGELALNTFDGKIFLKQDQGGVGVGTRVIALNATEVGNTFFVHKNGNDSDNGLSEERAFLTIKKATGIATSGDTIVVGAGKYVEDNPLVLDDNVTIIGADLRNTQIEPQNATSDVIHLGKGGTVHDVSFVGTINSGSAVIAYRPLLGVSTDRFFDGARLIRQNLDFIAAESTAYIQSTDYQNPAITVNASEYKENIKKALRAVCHDITRGGNSKSIGAGQEYFTGGSLKAGIGVTNMDALSYSAGIARSCINNITWTGGYQSTETQVRDLSIQADGGSFDIGNCSNVLSAVTTCVGIVTGVIKNGIDGNPSATGFTTNFPGNNGTINSGILTASSSPLQGTGVITKGPYIRNCTNFIKDSIGARIDGFNADEGDQVNNIGVQGSFNVDSYTQFNQGGIGVSVTNGAYAQLVSIFTICDDIAVYTANGGQCDLTNSNSSFGTKGLIAEGIGDQTSKCTDRYTGSVNSTATQGQNIITVSGVGNNRPYDGQSIYFDRKYFVVKDIIVTNGGSGYTSEPNVIIDDPTGPGIAIPATATATVENGAVTVVTVRSAGSQYESVPNVSFDGGGGSNAAATAETEAIYYEVLESTQPVSGITTISLIQNLNNEVGVGSTAFFSRQSLQIVSSHSFQYIGAGNTIETAYPSRGGVVIQENEVITTDGARVNYTSTDQRGNFRIGDGVVIDQATGTVSGNVYIRSLFTQVTPFILALGGD